MRTVYSLIIIIVCGWFWQCNEPDDELNQIEVRSSVNDQLFIDSVGLDLQFQEVVSNAQNGWAIQFSELIEESRCPANVVCIRSGSVTVRLTLTVDAQPTHIELTIGDRGESKKRVDTYVIELLEVEPYPEEPDKLKASDYHIKLSIYPQ